MSKYYWNEYVKTFGNDDELKDVLKLSAKLNASLITETKDYETEKIKLLRLNEVLHSDVGIKKFDIKESNDKLYEIYISLKKIYSELPVITSMPILVNINAASYGDGVYSIDFNGQQLILIEKNVELLKKDNIDYVIAFFLNTDVCVALNGLNGFIYGIEEIGTIIGSLKQKMILKNYKCNMPRRAFIHKLGIDNRKCSLIDLIAI